MTKTISRRSLDQRLAAAEEHAKELRELKAERDMRTSDKAYRKLKAAHKALKAITDDIPVLFDQQQVFESIKLLEKLMSEKLAGKKPQ